MIGLLNQGFSTNPMEAEHLIYREDVIGKRIKRVSHFNLPFDPEGEFQERLIIVELETGLRFSLQKETNVLDPVSGLALIYSYEEQKELELVVDIKSEPNLESFIKSIALPYGWDNRVALILENGFVMHDGFSMWDNGVVFYVPTPPVEESMAEIELPKRA